MSRKVVDVLTSAGGAVIVVVLLVAGGLLTWGHSFVTSNVRSQLAQQQIAFPSKAAFAHAKAGTEITPSMIPSVSQYAGQQLLTGVQAKAYADDFIAQHLKQMPYGGVYSKISSAALANPRNPTLGGPEADIVHGNDPAWPAARGVRVLGDRDGHDVGSSRVVHPRGSDVDPRRSGARACPPDRARGAAAAAEGCSRSVASLMTDTGSRAPSAERAGGAFGRWGRSSFPM